MADIDLTERLRVNSCRYAHETQDQAANRRIATEIEAANEIERLRRRVVVLEMVIQEELDEFDCRDEANGMIVEEIHGRGAAVGSVSAPEVKP